MKLLAGHYRHDILNLLPAKTSELVGVELGVAEGEFSRRMVETGRFKWFFGVDMYADQHDTREYKLALRHAGLLSNYKLLRMTFDEALDLFDDLSLDFVYVDGYAHTGEEGGDTIYKWFRKVKVGGLIAGDDYAPNNWPLVVEAVDQFARDTNGEICLTECVEAGMSAYPTWGMIKMADLDVKAPEKMVARGKQMGRIVDRKRSRAGRLRNLARGLLPPSLYGLARRGLRLLVSK